jgi:hypothetical protein
VWLNLPENQQHYTFDVGMWSQPPPGLWEKTLEWMGMSDKPKISDIPRVLGVGEKIEMIEDEKREITIQSIQDDGSMEIVKRAGTESTLELAMVDKQQSTPLHQGRRSRRWRRRDTSR